MSASFLLSAVFVVTVERNSVVGHITATSLIQEYLQLNLNQLKYNYFVVLVRVLKSHFLIQVGNL